MQKMPRPPPAILEDKSSNCSNTHQLLYSRVRRRKMIDGVFYFSLLILINILILGVRGAEEDCPWYQDSRVSGIIKSHCQCARNPSTNNRLSIQCQEIDASQLVSSLTVNRGKLDPIELLYLNASKVTDASGQVPVRLFRDVKMVSLQISGCGIKSLHPEAFRGQENSMKHLSLTLNHLTEVPKSALDRLTNLNLLDLSYNKITKIPPGTFEKLNKLSTLKLNDNNLQIEPNAFRGLENSLRNLNLKGTRISVIPDAIANLSALAFLDLAQNRLRDLDSNPFVNLHSLAALNLERNLLQTLPSSVFISVNDTLSSLSLLNNLITHFPVEALHYLHELRVLDLGFNLLTEIPTDAFNGLNSLTLLALDGNPLATLQTESFSRLNTTLRGLSLGGRFLSCDCRIRWVAEWIQKYDLQVTSRERSPQFCGSPPSLRQYTFYQLKHDDFQCDQNDTIPVPPPTLGTSPRSTSSSSTSSKVYEDLHLTPEDMAVLGLNTNFFESILSESEEEGAHESEGKEDESKDKEPTLHLEETGQPSKEKPPVAVPDTAADFSQTSYETEDEGTDSHPADSDHVQKTDNNPRANTIRPTVKRASTPSPTPRPSTTETTTVQSIRKFPQPIKSFANTVRARVPKPVTTTSTSTSTSTSISTSSRQETPRPALPSRKPGVITLGSHEIEDAKIPIITGIGQRVSTVPNPGSVVPVRVTPVPSSPIPRTTTISTTQAAPHISNSGASQHHNHHSHHVRPNNLIFAEKSDIQLREIERNGDSMIVQWDSHKQTGFRIIYRIFGDDTFRHGPPLAPTEREFRIQNIPYNECVVVCVVPYEEIVYNEISPSASSIPPGSQCREMKPSSPSALMNHMDKITIGASVAICFAVLLAVLIFICYTRRAKNRRPPPSIIAKAPPGSFPTPSPGPTTTMITPGSLSLIQEWDQMSAMSTKSIPRARVYNGTMDGPPLGNGPARTVLPMNHSHSHSNSHLHSQHQQHQRSVPDGHSTHRSYLSSHHALHNHSLHSYTNPNSAHNAHQNNHTTTSGAVNSYLNNQSRLLRASVGSRSSQDALNKQLGPSAHLHRHFEQNNKRRRAARLSQSDSLNTLSGYETPDNWTDHDMDVYVARNATHRHDLVQL